MAMGEGDPRERPPRRVVLLRDQRLLDLHLVPARRAGHGPDRAPQVLWAEGAPPDAALLPHPPSLYRPRARRGRVLGRESRALYREAPLVHALLLERRPPLDGGSLLLRLVARGRGAVLPLLRPLYAVALEEGGARPGPRHAGLEGRRARALWARSP